MPKDLFCGQLISADYYELTEAEFHHAIRVTRHKLGDEILITSFNGIIHNGCIDFIGESYAKIKILSTYKSGNLKPKISIAISPTQSSDRFEWFVEKAIECGVDEIIPISCHRTEKKKLKVERIQRIILAACKQSQRTTLINCNELISYKNFVLQEHNQQKFICHCMDEIPKKLVNEYRTLEDVLILIGPEGDFTTEEVKLSIENGFTPVSLGLDRLRTETAGVVATTICNQKYLEFITN